MFRTPSRILFPARSLTSPFRQPFSPSHLPPRPRPASSFKDFVDGIVEAVASPGPPMRNRKVRHSKETFEGLREMQSKGDEYKYKPPSSSTGSKQSNSSSQASSPSDSDSTTRHQFTHTYRRGPRQKSAQPTHLKNSHLPRPSAPATSKTASKGRILSPSEHHARGFRIHGSSGRMERVDMGRAKKMREKPPIAPEVSMSVQDFDPPSKAQAPSPKPKPSPSSTLSTSTVGLGVPRIKQSPLWRRTEVLSSSSGIGRGSVELDEEYSQPSSTKSSRFSESSENSKRTLSSISPPLYVGPPVRRSTARVPMDVASRTPKDEVKARTPDQTELSQLNLHSDPVTTTPSANSSMPIPFLASSPSIDQNSVSSDDIEINTDPIDPHDFSWIEGEDRYQALLEAESFYHPGKTHSLPWFLHPALFDLSFYHPPNSSISRHAALQSIDNARSSALRSIRDKLDLLRPPTPEILADRQAVDEARERERQVHLNKLEGKEILIEGQSWITWTSSQYHHYQLLEKLRSDYLAWYISSDRLQEEEDRLMRQQRLLSNFSRFFLSSSRQPYNLPTFPRSADQLYSARLYTDSTFTKTYPVPFSKVCQVSPRGAYTRGGLKKLESVEKRNRKKIERVWKEIEKIGR